MRRNEDDIAAGHHQAGTARGENLTGQKVTDNDQKVTDKGQTETTDDLYVCMYVCKSTVHN